MDAAVTKRSGFSGGPAAAIALARFTVTALGQ
jgi:hypothetical protein